MTAAFHTPAASSPSTLPLNGSSLLTRGNCARLGGPPRLNARLTVRSLTPSSCASGNNRRKPIAQFSMPS
jgi:hypothetical protein